MRQFVAQVSKHERIPRLSRRLIVCDEKWSEGRVRVSGVHTKNGIQKKKTIDSINQMIKFRRCNFADVILRSPFL